MQQLPLDAFFSLLPQFSFSSLSTLSIVNPLLADADPRSLTYLLQSHNLPLYVLINGGFQSIALTQTVRCTPSPPSRNKWPPSSSRRSSLCSR